MSAGMMIQAEGITWPLETFLDAHRYIRTNGEVPPFHNLPGAVDALMASGEVRENVELSSIAWHDCLAVKISEQTNCLAMCHGCEQEIVELHIVTRGDGKITEEQELCNSCDEDCY